MKKSVAIILLLSYLAMGGFGFLFMLGMDHHSHTYDCPFMPGEKVLCIMDIFDHAGAWKGMFTSVLPALFLLTILFTLGYKALILTKELDPPGFGFVPQIRHQRISVERSQYQTAFSRGILHPKNP